MRNDLGEALKTVFAEAQAKAGLPDLGQVRRGGRGILWRQRAGTMIVIGALLVGGWTLLSSISFPTTQVPRDAAGQTEPAGVVVPNNSTGRLLAPEDIPAMRVITFATRAVAASSLTDTTGYRYEYRALEEAESGWLVTFATAFCQDAEHCEDDETARLTVEAQPDALTITEAIIPGGDADVEDELLSYRELPTAEMTGLEFLAPALAETPDEGLSVVTSELWTGPLPQAGSSLSVTCQLELYDGKGAAVHSGGQFEVLVPTEESARTDAGIHQFGAPAELESSVVSAAVVCGRPHELGAAPNGSRKPRGLPHD